MFQPTVLTTLCYGALLTVLISSLVSSWRKNRTLPWKKRSPYEHVPGPETSAVGYLLDMHNPKGLDWHFSMTEKYGHVARLKGGLFMKDALYVADPAALQSILVRDQYTFPESNEFVGLFGIIHHGEGVASVAGLEHKRHRKLMDPVFNNSRMAKLTPLFYNVIYQLQQSLLAQVSKAQSDPSSRGTIDILEPLTRTSIEMIAQGGLGHTFNSFDPNGSKEYNEFHWAITNVLPLASGLVLFMPFLNRWRNMEPVWLRKALARALDWVPWRTPSLFRKSVDAMWPIYRRLYDAKMKAIDEGGLEALDQNPTGGQDLMTVIFKLNHENPTADKLSAQSVMANISSLVHGAQETTSSTLARFFDLLSQNQDLQQRLREEIKQAKEAKDNGEELTFSEVNALPLLDAVVKETFRVYAPVIFVWRQTTKDIVVPLQFPFRDPKTGEEHHQLLITKGTFVYVSMGAANMSKAIWGEDAHVFKPERWLGKGNGAVDQTRLPGVYSNMMTFLGGQRACPGMKFALLEIKLVLSALLQAFAFEPTGEDIDWKMGITLVPYVRGREKDGAQVPVKVKILD
ncbi:hypothetical protein AX16_009811 [Volvariella volvacea WC 439]|nr:hypothetical protein AX16_009811 [Volvariella volvacea WC 439]